MTSPRRGAFLAGLLIGLVIYALVWAQHGHWTDAYRGAEGSRCCGIEDCRIVHARLLAQDGKHVVVEVDGMLLTLPAQSVHASEDLNDWVCEVKAGGELTEKNVRCVFLATGS